MECLSVDIESYCDINIGDSGAYRYVEDQSFEVLLFAYSVDFGPPEVIDLAQGEDIPVDIVMALFDPSVTKRAFNAAFEWPALSKHFGLDRAKSLEWLRQWKCDMVHSYYLSYAGGLDTVGEAVGLDKDKKKLATGKALIRYFCQPCKPSKSNGGRTRNLPHHDPEKWELFKEYNGQDVVAENAIFDKIKGIEPPEWWWNQWYEDMEINSRGAKLDRQFIEGAIRCNELAMDELMAEFKQITGLDNPNSNVQFLSWINSKGCPMDNVQKATVENKLSEEDLTPEVRRALELRQLTSKTSTKKYYKMLDCISPTDNRVRGLTQYAGASRTNRWAGRLLQIQNFPRSYIDNIDIPRELIKQSNYEAVKMFYGDVADTTSQAARTAFIPSTENGVIIDADFTSVEAVVGAFLSGQESVLEIFRTHCLLYESTASAMYSVPLMDCCKGGKLAHLRSKGKIAVLACSYGGGIGSLQAFDAKGEIPDDQKQSVVDLWRNANPEIVKAWYQIGNAMIDTIKTGASHVILNGKSKTELINSGGIKYLRLYLPSGRAIHYTNPHITQDRWGRDSIGFYGMNQITRKWERQETYGPRCYENLVQAASRDLLANAISNLNRAGYEILFHIHDEVAISCPSESDPQEELENVMALMCELPEWAEGLPLKADGWTAATFRKG